MRNKVKTMAGFGISQEQIAQVIGIKSTKTLRKYFQQEIAQAAIIVNMKVANSLCKAATGGNVPAAIFWMKTRGGWYRAYGLKSTLVSLGLPERTQSSSSSSASLALLGIPGALALAGVALALRRRGRSAS